MLFYRETNSGAKHALVFLHGGGTTHAMWREIVDLLPDYNCVLVDLPDHGESRHVKFKGFEDAASHVVQIINNIKAESITLVGLSLGGYIAAAVSAYNLPGVCGIIISGINVDPLPGKWWIVPLSWIMLPFLKVKFVIRSNAKMMGIPESLVAEFMEGATKMNRRAFLKITTEACDYSASQALMTCKSPVLLLAGDKENKVVMTSTRNMPERADHVSAYFVSGLGHIWTAQNPPLMAQVIEAFKNGTAMPDELRAVENTANA